MKQGALIRMDIDHDDLMLDRHGRRPLRLIVFQDTRASCAEQLGIMARSRLSVASGVIGHDDCPRIARVDYVLDSDRNSRSHEP